MTYIKNILSERNLVIILFVIAFCIFSLAQEDTRRHEQQNLHESAELSNLKTEAPATDVQ